MANDSFNRTLDLLSGSVTPEEQETTSPDSFTRTLDKLSGPTGAKGQPLYYSEMAPREQEFLPEDAGILDYLGVLERPVHAVISGAEGAVEDEDIGQILDRVQAELFTPGGITGAKEVLMRQLPGAFDDVTMEDVYAEMEPLPEDAGFLPKAGRFIEAAYEAADPVDIAALGLEIGGDPLLLAGPAAKGVKLVGGAVAAGVAAKAPRVAAGVKFAEEVALKNPLSRAIRYNFDKNAELKDGIRFGHMTPEGVQDVHKQLAQLSGKEDVAMFNAINDVTQGAESFQNIERDAISHLMEDANFVDEAGKFIQNPVGKTYEFAIDNQGGLASVNISQDMVDFSNKTRKFLDDWEGQFAANDMNVAHLDRYIHHFYPQKDKRKALDKFLGRGEMTEGPPVMFDAQGKPFKTMSMAKPRTRIGEAGEEVPWTLQDAIQAGLDPETDIANILTKYHIEASRTVATKKAMNYLLETQGTVIDAKQLAHLARTGGRLTPGEGYAFVTPHGRFKTAMPRLEAGTDIKTVDDGGKLVMRELTGNEVQGVIQGGDAVYRVPKELKNHLNNHFYVFGDEGRSTIGKAMNSFMPLWKSHALLSTGFHVRNFYSGLFNNWIATGLNPLKGGVHYKNSMRVAEAVARGDLSRLKGVKTAIKGADGKAMTLEDLAREAMGEGTLPLTTYVTEGMQPASYLKKVKGFGKVDDKRTLAATAKGLNPFGMDNVMFNANRLAGNATEHSLRMAAYLHKRSKGASPFESAKGAMRGNFDYKNGLTKFEYELRDNFFPFYTWLRMNIPFQVENLIKQPAKYAGVPKVVRAISGDETPADERWKPDYFNELGMFKMPTEPTDEGYSQYLQLDFPFKDLMKVFALTKPLQALMQGEKVDEGVLAQAGAEILQSLGPIPKAAIEQVSDYNLFQGRPYRANEFDRMPAYFDVLPDVALEALGVEIRNGVPLMHRKDISTISSLMPFFTRLEKMIPYEERFKEEHMNAIFGAALGLKVRSNDLRKHVPWKMAAMKAEQREQLSEERGIQRAAQQALMEQRMAEQEAGVNLPDELLSPPKSEIRQIFDFLEQGRTQ